MDQITTGRFIASERKIKGLTQRQLADTLGVSDKAISKWETGKGFPDISLLMPLCDALGITVSELLCGERIADEDSFRRTAEDTMLDIVKKERTENRQKMFLTLLVLAMGLVAFLTLLLVVCLYTDVISVPVKGALIGIACLFLGIGVVVSMVGLCTIGYYRCDHCGTHFVPSAASFIMAPNVLRRRYLHCPSCKRRSLCRKVMGEEDAE